MHIEDTVATRSRFSRETPGTVAMMRWVAAVRSVAPASSVAAVRSLAAVGTVALLLAAGVALARGADGTVSIVDFAFQPPTVTIDAGGTVTWTVTRAQDPHTVSPVDPPDAFVGTPLLRQGDHFSVTFARAGTYRYECTIHPEEMQGTVIVEAVGPTSTPIPTAAATGPTAAATSTATATSPPTATGTATPTGSPAPQEPTGGGLPPIIVVVAVLAAAGLGGWFLVTRRSRR